MVNHFLGLNCVGAHLYSEPVPMEIYSQRSGWSSVTYGVMRVTETGWDSEAIQSWMVKYTGKYRNNLVWAGDYKMDFSYLNVYNQSDVRLFAIGIRQSDSLKSL